MPFLQGSWISLEAGARGLVERVVWLLCQAGRVPLSKPIAPGGEELRIRHLSFPVTCLEQRPSVSKEEGRDFPSCREPVESLMLPGTVERRGKTQQ